MKQNVQLQVNQAQSRLTNKLLTVALAALTSVACLVSAQPALAQSNDFAAKAIRSANRVPGSRPIRSIDSKYCGSVSRGSRVNQQRQ